MRLITEAKNNFEQLQTEYELKKSELSAEYDNTAKKLKLERLREEEEFQYNLKRNREKENNSWSDEKAARQAELSKQEEQAAALLAEAKEKSEYIKTLEIKVEGISELIETEKKSVIETTTATLQREFEYKTSLSEKDYKNTITRLEDKITYLEKELGFSDKSVTTLQSKLDKAYSELRELATKTVESAGGVKIIGHTENKGG